MMNKNLLVGLVLISLVMLGLFTFIFDGGGIKSRQMKTLPEKMTEVHDSSNAPTILDELAIADATISSSDTSKMKSEEASTIIEEVKDEKPKEASPKYTGFAMQLGIFSNVENAEKFKSSVEKLDTLKNHSVIIDRSGTANKVLAVDFETYEKAKEIKTNLDKELKIKSIIIDLGK